MKKKFASLLVAVLLLSTITSALAGPLCQDCLNEGRTTSMILKYEPYYQEIVNVEYSGWGIFRHPIGANMNWIRTVHNICPYNSSHSFDTKQVKPGSKPWFEPYVY